MTDLAVESGAPARMAGGEGWRMVARGFGQLLITAGIIILLFVGYELWFTGIYTQEQQHNLNKNIATREWAPSKPDVSTLKVDNVPLGSGVAVVYIPRLGKHYHFVIVEGTGFNDLQKGPGHYPGTALPGQLGNFAVAGHRTTYQHPFKQIADLRNGDYIYLETKDFWFTYKIEDIPGTSIPWKEIVSPNAVQVAYAVPDQPDPNKVPKLRLLTFTSCHPEYSAAQRYVIHALMIAKTAKPALPPAFNYRAPNG